MFIETRLRSCGVGTVGYAILDTGQDCDIRLNYDAWGNLTKATFHSPNIGNSSRSDYSRVVSMGPWTREACAIRGNANGLTILLSVRWTDYEGIRIARLTISGGSENTYVILALQRESSRLIQTLMVCMPHAARGREAA